MQPVAEFEARLEAGGPSFMPTQVVVVPPLALLALGQPLPRRVAGTLNGVPIRRGLLPVPGGGGRYLILNKELCRAAGATVGQLVRLTLASDPEPDRVDMPEELAEALDAWPEAGASFAGLRASMQRAVAGHVATAKQPETRARRAVEIVERLARGAHPLRRT